MYWKVESVTIITMRILLISNYYPPFERGGYEQLCHDVVLRLQERGHIVEVLASEYGKEATLPKEPGINRLLRLSPQFNTRSSLALQFFLRRTHDEAFDLHCLRDTVADFGPEVIFIWNLEVLPRTLALQAEAMPGVAVVYWLAGYSPAEPDEYWEYWTNPSRNPVRRLLKSIFRRKALSQLRAEGKPVQPEMRHTAVVSNFMRQKGLQEGTLPPTAEVIYNGVEIEEFFQPVEACKGPLKLLQAGRLSQNKGAHVSIKALSKIVNEYGTRQVHLTLAGSGLPDEKSRLIALMKRLELESYVTFLGWVPREQMAQKMQDHHVLLLPTIHQEAFARVVLEAMAAGLAVIAADTGGTSELVQHNHTGLLCQAEDEIMLARQIQRLVEYPQLRLDLARQGQQRVLKNYSLDHMVDNLERFLRKAIRSDRKLSPIIEIPGN